MIFWQRELTKRPWLVLAKHFCKSKANIGIFLWILFTPILTPIEVGLGWVCYLEVNIWYLATSSKWSLAIYNSQVYSPHLILRSLSCLKLKQKLDRNPYSIGRNTNCTQRESWPGQEEALKIERSWKQEEWSTSCFQEVLSSSGSPPSPWWWLVTHLPFTYLES